MNKNKINKSKYSIIALFFILVIYSYAFYSFKMWETGAKGGDPLGYFTYLPATFIYQDLAQLDQTNIARGKYLNRPFDENYYEKIGAVTITETGNKVNKYTCGFPIMISPFFGIAHLLAPIFDYPQDGFAPIYIFFFYLAGFLYPLLGLILLRSILLRWFPDKIVALTLILIALGTNLYFFSVYHSSMTHATLFFLHVLALHQCILLYEKQKMINALILGWALGMVTLIRPVEIILALIPIVWGLKGFNKEAFIAHWNFLKEQRLKIAFVFLAAFICAIPQLVYCYQLSGQVLYYSYGNEGFNFSKPMIFKGLFSYSNGWLAYTPLMYFALIGIFFLPKKQHLYALLAFLPLHIYITYSWWCWYYINGYGSRPMVEVYGLMSLPLASFWLRISKKKILFYATLFLAFFFVYVNMLNTWQFYKGIIRTESTTFGYYLSMIGKTEMDYEDMILFDCGEFQPDSNNIHLHKRLYFNDFEKDNEPKYQKKHARFGKYSYLLDHHPKHFEVIRQSVSELDLKKGDYIKANLWARKEMGACPLYGSAILAIRFESKSKKGLKTRRIRLNNKIDNHSSIWGNWRGNIWGEIPFHVHVPSLPPDAVLVVYLENRTKIPLDIDDFSVEIWRENE
jgi:hypothetical protein